MSGCASSEEPEGRPGRGGSSGSSAGNGQGADDGSSASSGADGDEWLETFCDLNNCTSDADCKGCDKNRKKCNKDKNRCMMCIPGEEPSTCGDGKTCSKSGMCINPTQTCPTDAQGEPTVNCNTNEDCSACPLEYLTCDTNTNKCVDCTEGPGGTGCPELDKYCKVGKCVPKCPTDCATDADCAKCGEGTMTPYSACGGVSGTACAVCSKTKPCPEGQICDQVGKCLSVCGDPKLQQKGACTKDEHCAGCAADMSKCIVPINGGEGRCGLEANGCSDIPMNFAVLPEPWSKVTNLCSKPSDCSGVGIDLNVGKLLRDITGLSQIKDAVMKYPMSVCATVLTVGISDKELSCGICVPCSVDSDCKPIKFDSLIEQAFGPVGSAVAEALIKLVFKKDPPYNLNMYCESVAHGYGVCAPCIDFIHECANASSADGCLTSWECPGELVCKEGECVPYTNKACLYNSDCTDGRVCAHNGTSGKCCRPPFTGTTKCFSEADCQKENPGDVCATPNDGDNWWCVTPTDDCI